MIYAVACKKAPLGLLSAAAVAEIVDREVWERRFGCSRVQHGAFLWLRSLEEENPQLGGDVRQRIRDFRPKAGLTPGAGVGPLRWAPSAWLWRCCPSGAGRCGSRGIAAVTAVPGPGGRWLDAAAELGRERRSDRGLCAGEADDPRSAEIKIDKWSGRYGAGEP